MGEIKDQSQPETKTEEASKTEAAGAPESYADFKLPEGVAVDKAALEAALPVFKELGLTQEQAQKLVDLQAKSAVDTVTAAQAKVTEMRDGWVKTLKADPEIGAVLETKVAPEIGKLKNMLPEAVRAEFNDAMNFTGAGDHPGVVKALYHIAKLVGEGTHVSGSGPSKHGQSPAGKSEKPTLAGAMYPNLPQ